MKLESKYEWDVHKFRANILTTCEGIITVHSGVIIFSKFSFNNKLSAFQYFSENLYYLNKLNFHLITFFHI